MKLIINSIETEQETFVATSLDTIITNLIVDFTVPQYEHESFELNGQISLEYSMVKDWSLEEIRSYIHKLVVEKAETLGVIPFAE